MRLEDIDTALRRQRLQGDRLPSLEAEPSEAAKGENGLLKLVLGLAEFLHELMERQAVRRMDSGTLGEEEIDRLGLALSAQAGQLEKLRNQYGLKKEDLNFDLGPIGTLF